MNGLDKKHRSRSTDSSTRRMSVNADQFSEIDQKKTRKTTIIREKITSFFSGLWGVITFPFKYLYSRLIKKTEDVAPKIAKLTTSSNEQTDLTRFISAQDKAYELAKSELAEGKKKSHWIWYIFPQHKDLGFSATSKFYGLNDDNEALSYLLDDKLGPRLIECTELVLSHTQKNLQDILSSEIDVKKFFSSMEIFNKVIQNHLQAGNPPPAWLQDKTDIFAQGLKKT